MARRTRLNLALRPVNRIKHVIDRQGGLTAGTRISVVLIDTLDTPLLTDDDGVETGSKINGFFAVIEATRVGTTSDVLANVYVAFQKNPGANLTLPEANAVGVSDNKKWVFHQEMVMMQGTNAGNPRTVFKGVIAIPRHMRRNGPNDRIQVRIFSAGVAINWCLQVHYKEFR